MLRIQRQYLCSSSSPLPPPPPSPFIRCFRSHHQPSSTSALILLLPPPAPFCLFVYQFHSTPTQGRHALVHVKTKFRHILSSTTAMLLSFLLSFPFLCNNSCTSLPCFHFMRDTRACLLGFYFRVFLPNTYLLFSSISLSYVII